MAKKVFLETRSEPALYTLIGISCHLKDYRLSYLLNHYLELEFIKMDDFFVSASPKKNPDSFSFYHCTDEDHYNAYFLLSNRGQEFVLLPEMRQTDFLLLVEGPFKKSQLDQIQQKIRNIPNVLTCYEIKFSSLKNYESLLMDLELHFTSLNREAKVKYSSKKNKEDMTC